MMAVTGVTLRSGVRIAGREEGPDGGAPAVFLHALGECASDWAPVVGAFARRHRTLALDLRGHGESDWPGVYSFAAMTADVEEVLDRRGWNGVVLVGHSMGGIVALGVAARRPELVGRLVVEDVAPPRSRPARPLPPRPDGALGFDWATVAAIRGEVDAGMPELWEDLARITAPTLFVAGGRDSPIAQDDVRDAAARVPAGELVTVEGGHLVHQAHPDRFSDTVLAWLDVVTSPSGDGAPARCPDDGPAGPA